MNRSNTDTLARIGEAGLEPSRMPRHVAVIMDGNGRWARERGLPRFEGHRRGVLSVRSTVEECCKLGVDQLTLYCLSSENWKRPQAELDFLMALLHQYLIEERREIMEQNIRFSVIGDRLGLPPEVLGELDLSLQQSAANTGMRLCLAINYGARGEITEAVRQIAAKIRAGEICDEDVNESLISASLYTNGMIDPDLLIRTAGEMRVSNFLLWQISYAELWVTKKCWPDFDREELHAAFRDFGQRDRTFGGLPES